jgi:hypothetical protein
MFYRPHEGKNCEREKWKKTTSYWGKLIEEFAVGICIEQLSTHLGQHLTGNHLQAIFESVVDSNTSVECTQLNSTASEYLIRTYNEVSFPF